VVNSCSNKTLTTLAHVIYLQQLIFFLTCLLLFDYIRSSVNTA